MGMFSKIKKIVRRGTVMTPITIQEQQPVVVAFEAPTKNIEVSPSLANVRLLIRKAVDARPDEED